jgi:hypothetical protein
VKEVKDQNFMYSKTSRKGKSFKMRLVIGAKYGGLKQKKLGEGRAFFLTYFLIDVNNDLCN